MRGRRRRRHARPMSEINVTPFVDVMLVLLIVFMVTAPLLSAGVPIDLPKAPASPLALEKEPLTVTIDPEARIFVGEEEVTIDELVPRLTALAPNGLDERIYVRGDRTASYGTTALGTGERVRKDRVRVDAYGTVDETNAAIGVARLGLASVEPDVDRMLGLIQNDLCDLGADLCVPDRGEPLPYEPLRISKAQVDRLEADIDTLNADLSPLRSFVLPGGEPAAAALHVARTICRRAERRMVELAACEGEPVSEVTIKYINRLSDFLFVASRYVNRRGAGDVLWVPGQNR